MHFVLPHFPSYNLTELSKINILSYRIKYLKFKRNIFLIFNDNDLNGCVWKESILFCDLSPNNYEKWQLMVPILLSLFFQSISSRRTISQILVGNWSGEITYSSDNSDFPIDFIISENDSPNYLQATFGSEFAFINLSSEDLSGNITFHDDIYYFNFTLKAPPFVSSDIDFNEHGVAHVRIASYESMHVTWTDGTSTFSAFIRKQVTSLESRFGPFSNWKPLILVAFIGVLQFLFRHFTKKVTIREYNKQLQKDAKQKKEAEEEEKESEKEKESEEKEDEEEKKETSEIKPSEPNKDGKIKAD